REGGWALEGAFAELPACVFYLGEGGGGGGGGPEAKPRLENCVVDESGGYRKPTRASRCVSPGSLPSCLGGAPGSSGGEHGCMSWERGVWPNLHRLSYLEAFRTLQGQNAEAVPWQMTGLRRVQALAGVEGGEGLFDSLVLVQTPEREMDAGVWTIEEDRGGMDFPVVVEIVPCPKRGVLEVTLHTHDLPLDKEEMAKVLKKFDNFLAKALREPREQIVPASQKGEWAAKTLERRDKRTRAGDVGAADETAGREWTDLELTVRGVVAAFTTVPEAEIGRGTSIWRLGLDSINAVQVATALRGVGYRIVASEVLMHPSVGALAGWIWGKSQDANVGTGDEVGEYDFKGFEEQYRSKIVEELGGLAADAEIEGVYPCTPVQSGMLAQTMHSSGVEYVNSYTLQLAPDVELEKLREAWEVVVKACPMLRAGFVGTEKGFAVVVYTAATATVPWVEGSEVGKVGEKGGMGVAELARRPWRLEVLRREVGVKKEGLLDGESIRRPPLPGPDASARDEHEEYCPHEDVGDAARGD
ncbi:hypothetical protein V500_10235, partial [Pseudogymnoascus sp. VKM F-4518 (FW-2643)]